MNRSDKERLASEIVELMGYMNAASYRLLTLIAKMEQRLDLFDGVKSMAHWLNWRCGISMTAAHEKVRVARSLDRLPKVSEAFRRGELSYSKVRAITRVATPFIEDELLDIARFGTAAHLERVVRGYRTATREEQVKQREHRSFEHYFDDDGMLVVRGRFAPEDGVVVVTALEKALATLRAEAKGEKTIGCDCAGDGPACEDDCGTGGRCSEGSVGVPGAGPTDIGDAEQSGDAGRTAPEEDAAVAGHSSAEDWSPPREWPYNPFGAERADAMALLCRSFVAGDFSARRQAVPHEVLLHIDVGALHGAGAAFYETGPGIDTDEVRRITCDASLVPVVAGPGALMGTRALMGPGAAIEAGTAEALRCMPGSDAHRLHLHGGAPLNVGRKRRTVPSGMRRALESRDRCCQFPSCTQRRHLQAHHLVHWADGGETSLENLALLCRFHHGLVHDGTFTVERSLEGELRFTNAHGRGMPHAPAQPTAPGMAADGLTRLLARHGIEVAAGAADSGWYGDRLDLHYAVWMLCHNGELKRARADGRTLTPGISPVSQY